MKIKIKLIFSLRPGSGREGLITLWHFFQRFKMVWKFLDPNSHAFFVVHLAALRPTLGHWQRDRLSTWCSFNNLFGHQEPSNEVDSLKPVERTVWLKPESFQFKMQHFRLLCYSHQIRKILNLKYFLISKEAPELRQNRLPF